MNNQYILYVEQHRILEEEIEVNRLKYNKVIGNKN